MHPTSSKDADVPPDALDKPLNYLPPPITVTAEMTALAARYWSHDVDWRYYPAFQAAAFLQPKSAEKHTDRREHFHTLKRSAEKEGFSIPEPVTELFTTDSYFDRLHHNCVWPTLPEQIVRLPADPGLAVLLILSEGQGCAYWHLLLAPDGTHTVITSDGPFGRPRGRPPSPAPDYAKLRVSQCMDSINRLLYHYFAESARHDADYVERLAQYFENSA